MRSFAVFIYIFLLGQQGYSLENRSTQNQALNYMRNISGTFVGRPLNATELNNLNTSPSVDLVKSILNSWVLENFFAASVRDYYEKRLGTSGISPKIDYRLPGNLIELTVANQKSMSYILTSKKCYNEKLQQISCDSQAPYQAGLLNTRAYLASHAGRFNLSRAGALMKVFLCEEYPMSEAIEKPVKKQDLIEAFRIQTKQDAIKQGVVDVFGNGSDCYTCHSQFAPHTQFFVKYNSDGLYVQNSADIGKQQSGGDLGAGLNGLSASHYIAPGKASSESSIMLNQPAANLEEAAVHITNSPLFTQCLARNAIGHILGIQADQYASIKSEFLAEVTKNIESDSSFQDLYVAIFSHPSLFNIFSPNEEQSP